MADTKPEGMMTVWKWIQLNWAFLVVMSAGLLLAALLAGMTVHGLWTILQALVSGWGPNAWQQPMRFGVE